LRLELFLDYFNRQFFEKMPFFGHFLINFGKQLAYWSGCSRELSTAFLFCRANFRGERLFLVVFPPKTTPPMAQKSPHQWGDFLFSGRSIPNMPVCLLAKNRTVLQRA
jgi:hypothetical protein